MKKIHYYHGCTWANGELQQSDTEQTTNWYAVTCKKCLKNKPMPIKLTQSQKMELDMITRQIIENIKKGV